MSVKIIDHISVEELPESLIVGHIHSPGLHSLTADHMGHVTSYEHHEHISSGKPRGVRKPEPLVTGQMPDDVEYAYTMFTITIIITAVI